MFEGLGVAAPMALIVIAAGLENVCALALFVNQEQHTNTAEASTESFVNFWII
jgi:hypothetical protein